MTRSLCLALIGALALSACGSDTDETLTARTFQAFGQKIVEPGKRAKVPPLNLTRARLAGLPPADLATVVSTGAEAVIFEVGENGDTATWSSVDDKTLGIRQGQIVATRGLRGDLVSAEVPPLARIAAGSGETQRVLVTIGEQEKTRRIRYDCTLSVAGTETVTLVQRSYATRRVNEDCTSDAGSFVNEYWFQGGTLRQAKQWMGEDLGFLLWSRLRD